MGDGAARLMDTVSRVMGFQLFVSRMAINQFFDPGFLGRRRAFRSCGNPHAIVSRVAVSGRHFRRRCALTLYPAADVSIRCGLASFRRLVCDILVSC